jgi:hypothetical protein
MNDGQAYFCIKNMNFYHHPKLLMFATGAVLVAIALRLYVGRRRFYRRNQYGLQVFANYGKSIRVTIFEKLLLFIATTFLVVAVILAVVFVLD